MALVTPTEMLKKAHEGKYAIGAFNAENMEMVQAIIAAAESTKSPVIIQTTSGTLKYAPAELYYANVVALAQKSSVPVAMHLDHGNSFALASQAYRTGYTSIMIDGSHEPLEKNIAITKRVVDMCHASDIPVEGELGKVGGKEDDTESEGSAYTDVGEAIRFVQETGVSSLAVGVGTAHGVYAHKPVLNIELITKLRGALPVPLVLHGASGLENEVVQECISRGMSKVNFATELRIAYTNAVVDLLQEMPEAIDPKKYGEMGRKAVQSFVEEKMRVCGCAGKAEWG